MRDGKRILSVNIQRMEDLDPDTSYLEQAGFEERLQEYRAGDFGYLGIMARAEVQLSKDGPVQVLTSGGLWGIESDSDDEYLGAIEAEELADIKGVLLVAGFSKRAVAVACKDVR